MVEHNDIHIGSIIRDKVAEKGMSVTDLASSIHCNRQNVYDIFKRKSLDVDLLIRISKILDCNLLDYYYDECEVNDTAVEKTILIRYSNGRMTIMEKKTGEDENLK